jgi:hypothetical protein
VAVKATDSIELAALGHITIQMSLQSKRFGGFSLAESRAERKFSMLLIMSGLSLF